MELINNIRYALDSFLDFFTCNLRPSHKHEYYNIIDHTDVDWRYNQKNQWLYIIESRENMNTPIFHFIRRGSREIYTANGYTMIAVTWSEAHVRHYVYHVYDNSKGMSDPSIEM